VPSGDFPYVGHLPRLVQDGDAPTTWRKMEEECGEIFRAKTLRVKSFVVTSNAAHAKEVLLNQGKYPYCIDQESWRAVFDEKSRPQSIPVAGGEDWRRRRKVLGETLLSSKSAKKYLPVVVPVANNFVACLEGHLNVDGRLVEPTSFRELANLFALEAVMNYEGRCWSRFPRLHCSRERKGPFLYPGRRRSFYLYICMPKISLEHRVQTKTIPECEKSLGRNV
jgi:cytochrome P450